jgi:DNA topoisomerase VI subunit B
MEAAYQRAKQSVDEFLKQCAIVNRHLTLHYRLALKTKAEPAAGKPEITAVTYHRAVKKMQKIPDEILPHPHGVELGLLMQMLKDTESRRTVRSALASTTPFGVQTSACINSAIKVFCRLHALTGWGYAPGSFNCHFGGDGQNSPRLTTSIPTSDFQCTGLE